MLGLIVLLAVGLSVLMVIGSLAAVAALVWWILLLPFRLIGFLLHGFAFVLALPILVAVGLVVALGLGFGAVFLLLPLAPFALLVWLAWWILRRRPNASPRVTG